MKNKILTVLVIGSLLASFESIAKAQTIDAWVNEFSGRFNSDGTGKALAVAEFGKVPTSDRAEVLARILDRFASQKPIDSNGISGAYDAILATKIPWTDHLQKSI